MRSFNPDWNWNDDEIEYLEQSNTAYQCQRLNVIKPSTDNLIALPDDWLDTALFIKAITEKSEGK